MTVHFVTIWLDRGVDRPIHTVEMNVDSPEAIVKMIVYLGQKQQPALLVEPARQLLVAILAHHEQHHGSKLLSSHDVLSLLRDRDRSRIMAILQDVASPGHRHIPHVAASMDLLRAFRHAAAFNATVGTAFQILNAYLN
jgi:hypothetical protein